MHERRPRGLHPERRHQAEQQRRPDAGGEREREHDPIQANGFRPRDRLRMNGEQRGCRPQRQQHTDHRSRTREHQALDDELLHEPSARGPQRRAHRDLGVPPLRAREQQVGHIHGGDDQHDRDGRQQQPQRLAPLADHILAERVEEDEVTHRVMLVFGIPRIRNRLQLAPRLLQRDAGPQAAQRQQIVREPVGRRRLVEPERRPQLDRRVRKPEALGHDPDDRGGFTVDPDGAADDRRVATESSLPQVVTQHRDRRDPGSLLLKGKRAAHRRIHAEQLEHAGTEESHPDALGRLVFAPQRAIRRSPGHDVLHQAGLRAVLDHLRRRERKLRDVLSGPRQIARPQRHELIGLFVR